MPRRGFALRFVGTVKLTDTGQKCCARLSLMRFAGVRFRSTSAWLRFSIRGDGLMKSRGVECEKGWRQGHELKRNAGDVGLT